MSLAVVYSRAQAGVEAPLVTVEVQLTGGLPALSIVGLPETAVRESKDRVRGALLHSGFEFPPRRITINLAPADLPKEGGRFDLPIALGILAATGQLAGACLDGFEFIGELALGGSLRRVTGTLPGALQAGRCGRTLICPAASAAEAALAGAGRVLAAAHLLEVCGHLAGEQTLAPPATPQPQAAAYPDLRDVRGQTQARRALEIAAAGGHNLLFSGPPGTGKTLLASRLPGLLPPLDEAEALECAAVASVSRDGFDPRRWRQRPFRAPHHSASGVALVGGGPRAAPGEISLAHQGVLFLDELPEFSRSVLDLLREPLESGRIVISRAARRAEYPARFQLVAAMNPCPCGYLGDSNGRCRCTAEQVQRYRARLSGPLLDRIDLHIEVPRLDYRGLRDGEGEDSASVRRRVLAARQRQAARGALNARLEPRQLESLCPLDTAGDALLARAMQRFDLSLRAVHRIIKVARTIADLAGTERIGVAHLGEAIACRCGER
ncbi:MAG TPA: ATP-dependent protease [Gammaproteobacteria bacterium]|nr:ATP-dependent protease [Gammaproteobacteria bacterium]